MKDKVDGRLSDRQAGIRLFLQGSDCHRLDHCWTYPGMERTAICQLSGLPKSLRQPTQRETLAANMTLRYTGQDQVTSLPSGDRGMTGMPFLKISVSTSHPLGDETDGLSGHSWTTWPYCNTPGSRCKTRPLFTAQVGLYIHPKKTLTHWWSLQSLKNL